MLIPGISLAKACLPGRHGRQAQGRKGVLGVLVTMIVLAWSNGLAQFDRPWRVFLVPFSHTDVGYTAPVETVIQQHLRYIDTALVWVQRTRANEEGARFRWTVEIPWVLDFYIAQRSPAQVESLMACVRRGEMDIGAIHFGLQSDLCGNEEIVRSLYSAQELRNKFNVPVRTGIINDTPGFTWAFAQLLAKGDIPYLSVAMNNFFSNFFTTTTLPALFYWQGQNGSKTLVWRSLDPNWAYLEGIATLQVYGSASQMQTRLTTFLQNLAKSGYPFNEVLINCATGDNGAPNFAIVNNVREWNAINADARVMLATTSQFFDTVVARHATQIPIAIGDAPNWWSWMFSPSGTGASILARTAHLLLPAAETFATMASMLNPAYSYPDRNLRDAYVNNLYFEDHNLGANYPGGNEPYWALKMAWGHAAVDTASSILNSSLQTIAGQIPTGATPALAVFNPLGWARSVPVILSSAQLASLGVFDLIDGGGTQCPVQLLADGTASFVATDVPAVGYKVYRAVPRGGAFVPVRPLSGLQLENEHYRVRVDEATGAMQSIIDKRTNTELVEIDRRFNEYRYNGTYPPTGMATVSSDSGAVVQQVTLVGSARGASSFRTTVRVYRGLKRVDFLNTYDKLPPSSDAESVDFNFHFALPSPALRYEIPFGNVRMFEDELSGFRTKHYAVRQWLNVSSPSSPVAATIAMDNASVTAHPSGTFDGLVRMMISYNNGSTSYRAGIGPLAMNFSLSTNADGFQADSSTRHAYDFAAPAPVQILPAGQTGPLNGSQLSFLTVHPASVLISTVKVPMDGKGLIVRIYNPLSTLVPVSVVFARSVLSAGEVSLLEVPRSAVASNGNSVTTTLEPYGVKTLRVVLSGVTEVDDQLPKPATYRLECNYPNPFNPSTTIGFQLPAVGNVRLVVYDVLGREVKTLVRDIRVAGTHTAVWDGRDVSGRAVSSGIYYAGLEIGTADGRTFRQTRSMILVR
jgi:alpha-mannosidase